jgi:Putative Actinobacterial Holin-X, holin superfamily III
MADLREEKSLGDLFSDLAGQTTALVRQEIQLAKVELGQKAAQAGKDVGLISLGGAIAYAGFLAVLAGVILVLGKAIPVWLSALIVGAIVMAGGYFLSRQHLNALKRLDATPRATVETLSEDKQWVKEQMR